MTTTINRRTALAGTVALPLAPAAAMATGEFPQSAKPANATDAAWAQYQAGNAAFEEWKAAERAFDATLPEHLRPAHAPNMMTCDFDRAAFEAERAAWDAERALYPANPHETTDERLDAFLRPINDTEDAILETHAATLIDVERKLAVIAAWEGAIEATQTGRILQDVRRLNATA